MLAGPRVGSLCQMASLLPRNGCLEFVLNPNTPICGSLSTSFGICLLDGTKDLTLQVLISEAAQSVLSFRCGGLATGSLKEITPN